MEDRSNIIQEAIGCLKRLYKENAELKAENARLKSCLQEIKEIAKKECKDCLDKISDSCWICPYYPILEVITKVESEG